MTNYKEQAEKFLKDTETKMSVSFVRHGRYFVEDDKERDIFRITFTRQGVRRSFLFGQSLKDSNGNGDYKPTAYDVLACLEKCGYETFEDFCSSLKTFKAVVREAEKVNDLWNDVLPQLQEIQ